MSKKLASFLVVFFYLVFVFFFFKTNPSLISAQSDLDTDSADELQVDPEEIDISEIISEKDTSGFDEVYKTYLDKYEEYQAAHSEYILKRSYYLRVGTVQSVTEAKEATIKMLRLRDDVVIFYLNMLQKKLEDTPGVPEVNLSTLKDRISEESSWYAQHRDGIPTAGTLDDLVKDSKEATSQHRLTIRLYYVILSNISYGKVINYKQRLSEYFDLLDLKLEEIRSETREEYILPSEKIQILDRWMFDAENMFLRIDEKLAQASGAINEIDLVTKESKIESNYNEAIITLTEANQYLKESASYLNEVISQIKIKEI